MVTSLKHLLRSQLRPNDRQWHSLSPPRPFLLLFSFKPHTIRVVCQQVATHVFCRQDAFGKCPSRSLRTLTMSDLMAPTEIAECTRVWLAAIRRLSSIRFVTLPTELNIVETIRRCLSIARNFDDLILLRNLLWFGFFPSVCWWILDQSERDVTARAAVRHDKVLQVYVIWRRIVSNFELETLQYWPIRKKLCPCSCIWGYH
jgi:hypothetical protein